jgi:hypothetical protein
MCRTASVTSKLKGNCREYCALSNTSHYAFTRYQYRSFPSNPQCRQLILPLPLQRNLVFLCQSRILSPLRSTPNTSYHNLNRCPRPPIHVHISAASRVPSYIPRSDSMGERCVSGTWGRAGGNCAIVRSSACG